MDKKSLRGSFTLLITAIVWGVAFTAQSKGMDYIGPFTFNAVRFLLGGIVLIPAILVFSRKNAGEKKSKLLPDKKLIAGGIFCGLIIFSGNTLQQFGILHSSVGKAGFLTALYIIIVPLIGIFLGRAIDKKVWVSVAAALIGMYLLCMKDGFSIKLGDTLLILCAVVFSLHILVIDRYSPYVDGIILSCMQFFIAGILSLICMFIFEKPSVSAILDAWLPLLYSSVMSCGVAYTLQIIGQKNVAPHLACLILSLESVISALAGWAILGQAMTWREISGCLIIFAAIILAQLPSGRAKKGVRTAEEVK
ncbi:MAG: DMT family transporter [Oscillospiraceae bacterium]